MRYLFLIFFLMLAGCSERIREVSPFETYYRALVAQNLKDEAATWKAAGDAALQNPLSLSLPYAEQRLLRPYASEPVAFDVYLQQEQALRIETVKSVNSKAELFIDVFARQVRQGEPEKLILKRTKAPGSALLEFVADADAHYLVRIHSALQNNGLVELRMTSPARFGFPVAITPKGSVQSFFGVPRDGGRRRHEGIDIFAERGTPVVAAVAGRVARTGESRLGGKHVWLRGEGQSFYYAHLDRIDVAAGQRVEVGDPLGTVGNTGNARTTPPHLHFGVYKRFQGAIDPLPLVVGRDDLPEQSPAQLTPQWLAVNTPRLNVRAGPSLEFEVTGQVELDELVRVEAASGAWLRVMTAKGLPGFLTRTLVGLPKPAGQRVEMPGLIITEPDLNSPAISRVEAETDIESLGFFGGFQRVKLANGLVGWLLPQNLAQLGECEAEACPTSTL